MVKTGYKQTEIGVIPEDWEIIVLGDFTNKVGSGITPTGGAKVYQSSGRPFVRSQNIGWGDLKLGDLSYISEETHQSFVASEIQKDDVLLNITGASIGRSSVADERIATGNVNQHVCIIRTKSNELDAQFLNLFLLSIYGQRQIDSFQAGGNRQGLNFGQIRSFKITKPKLIEEQRAIAEAIGDVDGLIAGLDRLIAKKRDVKTATMQQLLTGKVRLEGFGTRQGYKQTEIGIIPQDWNVKPLKTISSMNGRIGWQGLKQSEFTFNPDDPFLITGMNFKDGEINWEEVYHIPIERYKEATNIQLRVSDVLMTKDGTIGKLLYVNELPYPGKASLNSHLLLFRPLDNQYNPKFLFYQLGSKPFLDYVELNKSGSTFFGITQEAVGKYLAFLPPLPEQQAIATVLSDMDAEIAALEARRAKTQAIKQAMMQELLTGRTRLMPPSTTLTT